MVNAYALDKWPSIVELRREQRDGYVMGNEHPELPLIVWCYTPKTMWKNRWNEVTTKARGLVTDRAGSIIAPGVTKFFNAKDHDPEWFKGKVIDSVTEKVDGSMINLFHYDDQWLVCSKGSFVSEQAQLAQEIIESFGVVDIMLDRRRTYIAELVHPKNRIVVDYQDEVALYLLTMFQRAAKGNSWIEFSWNYTRQFQFSSWISRMPKTFGEEKFRELLKESPSNFEGFVVRYKDNTRAKFKLKEYTVVHRIMHNNDPQFIAKLWVEDQLDYYLDQLSEELLAKVQEIVQSYQDVVDQRYNFLVSQFEELPVGETRKEFAEGAKNADDISAMFLLYDNDIDRLMIHIKKWFLSNFESFDFPHAKGKSLLSEDGPIDETGEHKSPS